MGASGNVGSCVVRHLVERGDDVRVLLRRTSSTRGIDGLDVERVYGDVFDSEALAKAMTDRDVVYYCVVDTRAELRDPAPLFRTNVEGLRNTLDVAVQADLKRFLFLSTIGTIAVGRNGETVDETTPFNWAADGGGYIASRRQAEQLVMDCVAQRGLPAIALNVSNPFGPPDYNPRQGLFVKMAALGKMPFYVRGVGSEVVGLDDAADALLLAAERGRIGERYIISDRYMSQRELMTIAAQAVGQKPPRFGIPMGLVYALGHVAGMVAKVLRKDWPFNAHAAKLMDLTSPADHGKATRELGWRPEPVEHSIARAAQFHVEHNSKEHR